MKTCFARVSESVKSRGLNGVCTVEGWNSNEIDVLLRAAFVVDIVALAVLVSSLSVLWHKIETKQMSTRTEQLVLFAFISYRFILFEMPLLLLFVFFLFDLDSFRWRFLSRTMAGFISPTKIFESEGEHWQTLNTRDYFNNKHFWGDGIECCLPIESICQCRIIGEFPFISK